MAPTRILMTLFFLGAAGFAVIFNANKPTLLVLHSYGEDYVWAREVSVGLRRVLDDATGINVHFHHMHTKRFNDQDALRRAGIAAREAIERLDPDVLLAVDDYAQSLAARYYVDDPKLKIVFAGLNGGVAPYGYDQARNVTGILERKPARALKEVLLSMARDRGIAQPRALYLADSGYSAERDAEHLAAFDWGELDYRPARFVGDFEAWQQTVKALSGELDFLLVGGYRKLHRSADDHTLTPASEVMGWTEAHATMPVIGMNVFNTEDGATLSVGVSPYEQGEWAANAALEILGGKSPERIAMVESSQYVVAVRKSSMERRGLMLPTIYEAFARATNNYYP